MKISTRTTLRVAAGVAAACLGFSVLGTTTARADPQGPPTPRALNGVGSDTTQDVLNALANQILVGGQKVIGSWDAQGSATFSTKPGCTIQRSQVFGSGAGRTALLNSLAAGDNCLEFARSSSLNLAAVPAERQLTYIPFGQDGLSFAVTANSVVPRSLALSELRSIYQCDPNFVGSGPNYTIRPVLPQTGSGTRSFILSTVGITEAQVPNLGCIVNGTRGGQPIEESSGLGLANNEVIFYSTAQYLSQSAGLIADKTGRTKLGTLDGVSPITANGAFGLKRQVYNVVPTARQTTSPYAEVFVGSSSLVCQATATISRYGFSPVSNCGDTSQRTATP